MKITKPKEKLLTLGLIAAVVAVFCLFNIPCLFKAAFGIICPGCGMTRAYLCLLRLDFGGAFSYHPMFWSLPVLAALYLFDGRLFKAKWLNLVLTVLIFAGFFINWMVGLFG